MSLYSWGKKTARNTPPFPLGLSPCYSTAPLGVYRYRHFTNLIKLIRCTEKENRHQQKRRLLLLLLLFFVQLSLPMSPRRSYGSRRGLDMNDKSTHVHCTSFPRDAGKRNIREIYDEFVRLLWLLAMSYQPKIKKNKVRRR